MLRSSALSESPIWHDRAGDRRRPRNRLDDGQLAALDALGDLDFAFAGQQRDGAHLAEVHPDRVVGLVERAGRQIELELLGAFAGAVEQLVFAIFLLGVDDFDAGAAERAEQVVELVRRRDVGGQQLVDLVVQQVALFLADGDELPHLIVFFFDRQRRVLLACSLLRRIKVCAYDSAINCSNVFFRSHKASISVSCVGCAVFLQPVDFALDGRALPGERSRLIAFTQSSGGPGGWGWRPISSTSPASPLLRRSRSVRGKASAGHSCRAWPARG